MKTIKLYMFMMFILSISFFGRCGGSTGGTPASEVDDGLSSDYFIKNLTFSAGTLKYPFNSNDWINYLEVPYTTDSITITAETNLKWQTIYIGEDKLSSNNASNPIMLTVGTNTVVLTVVAENGEKLEYIIYVTRCSENYSDAGLSELTIDGTSLNPGFDANSSNRNFSAKVISPQISLHAAPSAESEGASFSAAIKDITVSDYNSIALVPGINTLVLTSTAPDGKTKEKYTITVVRQTTDGSTKLLRLSIAGGDFNVPFNPAIYNYSIDVSSSMNPMNITAITESAGAIASATLNGSAIIDITSVKLPLGISTLIVKVANGTSSSNYTISATSLQGSDNADLSGLSVLSGTKSPRPIYPGTFIRGATYHDPNTTTFSKNKYEYVTVVYGFDSIKLTAKADDSTVKGIQFTADGVHVSSTLSGGTGSATIPLTIGLVTRIEISVLAGDSTTSKTYTLYAKLLNIDEFFWGIYAPSFDKSKNSWTKPQPGSFSRNGYVSGTINWDVTLAPVSTIKVTNYNDGKMDYLYNDGGFIANGTQECKMDSISGKNGMNLTKNPPFDLRTADGENVATLNYNLVVKKGDPAEAADSYTEITYMGQTQREPYKLTRPYPFTSTYDWSSWSDGL